MGGREATWRRSAIPLLAIALGGCGGCSEGGTPAPAPAPSAAAPSTPALRTPAPEEGDLVAAFVHGFQPGAPLTDVDLENLCANGDCRFVTAADLAAEGLSPGRITWIPGDAAGGDLFASPVGLYRLREGAVRFAGVSLGAGASVTRVAGTGLLVADCPQWRTVRLIDERSLEVRGSYPRPHHTGSGLAIAPAAAGSSAFVAYLAGPEPGERAGSAWGIARLDLAPGGSYALAAPVGKDTPWIPLDAPPAPTFKVLAGAGVVALVFPDALRVHRVPTGAVLVEIRATPGLPPPGLLLDAPDAPPRLAAVQEGSLVLRPLAEDAAPLATAPAPPGLRALFPIRVSGKDAVVLSTDGGARLFQGGTVGPVFGRTSPVKGAAVTLGGRALFVAYTDGASALYPLAAAGPITPGKPVYEGHDERFDVDREGALYLHDSERRKVLRFPAAGPLTATARPATHRDEEGAVAREAEVLPPRGPFACAVRDLPLPVEACAKLTAYRAGHGK